MNTLTGLAEVLSAYNGQDDSNLLEAYSYDYSFALPIKPRGVVKPQNREQVQKIVQLANQAHTPLVPISSGPPHFHGDTVPGTTEAIMIDLSGIKRIVRINRRNRVAIIETGVTYSQVQPELAKAGLRLATPLLPRANKSVVASLLEREPILIPRIQWSFLDPLRCVEVVWGDGVKMTTGDAESVGTLEQEWEKGYAQLIPSGPQQTDFYKLVSAAQGSMGIVTWASIRCELLPEVHKLFWIPSVNLESLIDPLYRILRIRYGDELFIVNKWSLASILGNKPDQIAALAEKLPPWIIAVGIAGSYSFAKEKVDYQQKDISDIVQQFGLQLYSSVSEVEGDEVLNIILNPSREPYWKLSYKGGCQDIFFLSTLDKTPEFIRTMYAVAERWDYPISEIGVYIQPIHQGASCHIEFNLPYDRNSPEETNRMKDLYTQASEELSKQGAYFSRPYGIWANLAFNRDIQTTTLLKKIKRIFDPNNIMNPGKLCF